MSSINIYACRLCLNTNFKKSVSLDDNGLLQLIEYCVGLLISTNDEPRILCSKCVKGLQNYTKFKNTCLESDSLWKSIHLADVKSHAVNNSTNKITKNDNNSSKHKFNVNDSLDKETLSNLINEKEEKIRRYGNIKKLKSSQIDGEVSQSNENIKIEKPEENYDNSELEIPDENIDTEEIVINEKKLGNNEYVEVYCPYYTELEYEETFDEKVDVSTLKIEESKDFSNKSSIENSIKQEDTNSNRKINLPEAIIRCTKCDKVYEKKIDFRHHLKVCKAKKADDEKNTKDKNVPSLYHCGICTTSTLNEDIMNQHLNNHFMRNDLECKLCNYSGRDFADIVCHRFSHHPKDFKLRFQCHICHTKVLSLLSLEFHYRSKHLNKKGGWCSVCSKEYPCLKTFKTHFYSHKIDKFICDHCGKNFYYRHMIVAHLMDHSDIRNFICDECGKGFKRAYGLRLHLKTAHSKNLPIKCSHCDKLFKNKYALDHHTKLVALEKSYQCEVCTKYFPTKSFLKKHMFWHTGERPHCCHVCGSRYKAKGQLKVHMRNHTGNMPHQCTQCNKFFATPGQLKIHNSVHTGVRPHKCLYCDRTFYSKKIMLAHCASRHKIDK